MLDRDWFLPSVGLTALSTCIAISFIPHAGLVPALRILPYWMAAAGLITAGCSLVSMRRRGVASPVAEMRAFLIGQPSTVLNMTLFMLLAGLNLIAFMWMKPLLNYMVPFWADPYLADLDHMLFLGVDPWTLFSWMAFPSAGLIYHPVWFILMIFALLRTAAAPPSTERSAVLLSYFVLWSLVGPTVHTMLPAAGPIFYERMGYGARFAGIDGGVETNAVADYLWSIYSTRSFGAGSGISAMPSMHVTMSTWTVLAFNLCAPRGRIVAITGLLVIFMLSIALGWHFAVDGIVGASAALCCHAVVLKLLKHKRGRSSGYSHPASSLQRLAE